LLLLAVTAGSASARSISSSNQNIRGTWRSLEFASSLVTVRCPLTLEGSFHTRTIAKVERSLIGAVMGAILKQESCTNGRSTPRSETLPWHLTYESFAGTLPNISNVNILIVSFRFLFYSTGCSNGEYGTETDNITGRARREAGGAITALEPVEGRTTMTLVSVREFCPASGRMRGGGDVTVLSSANRITLTLI
jgi:hypothetical protein